MSNNMVNHPKHYKESSLECIETMIIAFGASDTAIYCCMNAYKYMFRYKTKNGLEDLEKANWYLDKCNKMHMEYGFPLPNHYEELRKTLDEHIKGLTK